MSTTRGALGLAKTLDLMGQEKPPIALCPRASCGAPLIGTMVFPRAEFYCLECGGHFGFLDPRKGEPTPELTARMEALEAEWLEHAGRKLCVLPGWFDWCEKCKAHRESHAEHATDEERKGHEEALAWLRERAGKS